MSSPLCSNCRQPKATFHCELCTDAVCKNCAQHLDEEAFSFKKKVAPELKHTLYCGGCYDQTVAPALDEYAEVMKRAENAFVFFTTQRKEIPLIRRTKEVFKVENCPDRDETILRLAFFAAEQSFNAIMDVEVTAEKVRNEGYQKSKWRGTGSPALVDEEKLERQHNRNKVYR